MFTIEQIMSAHSKVKNGADFPGYIRDLKALGIIFYETYVSDGHSDYFGKNDYKASSSPKYEQITTAGKTDIEQFQADLKAHQEGQTSYPVFCDDAAKSGIGKWVVSIDKMTCTYYDKAGNKMLVEAIPG